MAVSVTIRRTNLDWARDIARSYRSALHAENPERCAQLDAVARERGQQWIAPTQIPAHLVDEALDTAMAAPDIEHFWGVPALTVRAWASKGLLRQHPASNGQPTYLPREVLDCQSRNRIIPGGRHDAVVAGQ